MENNKEAETAKVNESLEEMWNKPITPGPPMFNADDEEIQRMLDKAMKPGPIISVSPVPFKFNVRDEVYATHYKKNGIITQKSSFESLTKRGGHGN